MPQSTEIKNLTIVTSNGNLTFKLNDTDGRTLISALQTALAGKQATLVSGTNIKTINGDSILGGGNLNVSGLNNFDLTELTASAITSGITEIEFAESQRNCVEYSTNADLAIDITSKNKSDNLIWVKNTHNSDDIDVTIRSIKFGSTTISDIEGTSSIPSVGAGETIEIGIFVNNSKARITSRIL